MDNAMGAPETKADLARAMDDMQGAFEAFKATNEERLAEVEKKSSVDVLTTDKLARIEAALDANQRRMDELVLKSAASGAVRLADHRRQRAQERVRRLCARRQ